MEGPKPQYVEVAEILGTVNSKEVPPFYFVTPRYDTSWEDTGPLIERLEIDITKHRTGKWEATAWMPVWFRGDWKNPECVTGIGVTPLLAFCDLMIRLKREPEVLREVLKRLDS